MAALSERRGTITGPQRQYLTQLANEAFTKLVTSGVDVHHLDTLSMREASDTIGRLKELKAAGWPQDWKWSYLDRCWRKGTTT